MWRVLVGIGLLQLVTMVLHLVRTKGLALLLGPDQVGIMGVVDKAIALIVQTASLSMPFAAVRFLPEAWGEGPAAWGRLFRQMRGVLLAMVLPATGLAILVAALRPAWWGAELVPHRTILMVAATTIPTLALVPFLQNAVAGRMQQHRAMLVAFGSAAVSALAVIGAWRGGLLGYYAAVAGLGLGLVIPIAWRLGRTPITTGSPAPGRPLETVAGLPRRVWRFSGAIFLLAVTTPYAALFVHYAVLRNLTATGAGWMQAALGIALAMRMALGAAHGVFLTPNVNRGGAAVDRMRWADRFQETFCLLATMVATPLLLFPGLAVRLLYSSAFLPGAAFVALFVGAEVVGLISGTYQSLIIALDHLRFHVIQNLVAQGLVVALAATLVPTLGLLGAGLALLAAPVVLLISTLGFLHRRHRLRPGGRAGRLMATLILLLGLAGAVGSLTATDSTWGLVLRALVLLSAITAGLRQMSSAERATVLTAWTRLRR